MVSFALDNISETMFCASKEVCISKGVKRARPTLLLNHALGKNRDTPRDDNRVSQAHMAYGAANGPIGETMPFPRDYMHPKGRISEDLAENSRYR
jgi:hypothetical protein